MSTGETRHGLGTPDGELTMLDALIWDNALAYDEVFDAKSALNEKELEADYIDHDYDTMIGRRVLDLLLIGSTDNKAVEMPGEAAYQALNKLATDTGNGYLIRQFEIARALREQLTAGQTVHSHGISYILTDVPEVVPEGMTDARVTPVMAGSYDANAPGTYGIVVDFLTWGKQHDGEAKPIRLSNVAIIGIKAVEASLDQRTTEIIDHWKYEGDGSCKLALRVIQNYENIGRPDKAALYTSIVAQAALESVANTEHFGNVVLFVDFLRKEAPAIFKSAYDRIAKGVATDERGWQRFHGRLINALVELDNPDFNLLDFDEQDNRRSIAFADLKVRGATILRKEQGEK